jgi:hypothetical protein
LKCLPSQIKQTFSASPPFTRGAGYMGVVQSGVVGASVQIIHLYIKPELFRQRWRDRKMPLLEVNQ